MKTTLVQLEPHDDILSVLDRLAWVKTPRALLLWPEEGCGLDRRLDFVLLARRARALNLRVALVTQDARVRGLASEAGLAVFADRQQALRRAWVRRRRKRLRRPPPRDLGALRQALQALRPTWSRKIWVRALAFTAAVTAVLALVGFTLPGATVVLQPQRTSQTVTLVVQASPQAKAVTLSGQVPAHGLEVTVSGQAQGPCTGTTQVPYRPATAVLRFTNLTDAPVVVPAGTLVASRSAPAHRFATQQEGVVPPLGTLTVAAQAQQPGAEGNRPAHDLEVLEPPLAFRLAVTNPQPATGGQDLEAPAVRAADRSALRQRLEAQLRQEAWQELQAQVPAGDHLLKPSFQQVALQEEIYSAQVGEAAPNLSLTLRITYRALVVHREDLEALARRVLDARLGPGQTPLEDTLVLEDLTDPEPAPPPREGDFRWTVRAQRWVVPRIAPEPVAQGIAGATPQAAQRWLQDHLPLAAAPKIRLHPSWWPRLPWLAYRIEVQVAP